MPPIVLIKELVEQDDDWQRTRDREAANRQSPISYTLSLEQAHIEFRQKNAETLVWLIARHLCGVQ